MHTGKQPQIPIKWRKWGSEAGGKSVMETKEKGTMGSLTRGSAHRRKGPGARKMRPAMTGEGVRKKGALPRHSTLISGIGGKISGF